MLPVCNQGLSPIVGQIREVVQPVEVPVAAFPLRGRFNPYCKYLLPLLLLRILIFVSLLGALISAIIIPRDLTSFNNILDGRFLNTRAAAIVIYTIALAFTVTTFLVELLSCCNIADSRYTPIIISLLDLLFALSVLGISIPMIVREIELINLNSANTNVFTLAADQNTFLAAGILGVIAAAFYMFHLFLSRFYQFCIGNYKNLKREFMTGVSPVPNTPFVNAPQRYL